MLEGNGLGDASGFPGVLHAGLGGSDRAVLVVCLLGDGRALLGGPSACLGIAGCCLCGPSPDCSCHCASGLPVTRWLDGARVLLVSLAGCVRCERWLWVAGVGSAGSGGDQGSE